MCSSDLDAEKILSRLLIVFLATRHMSEVLRQVGRMEGVRAADPEISNNKARVLPFGARTAAASN